MSGIIAQNSARHTGLIKSASGGGGTWNLILTQTASDSSTISFTSGIDSTYDEYVFKFYNINPADDLGSFYFQSSVDGGSNYTDGNITSNYFNAEHSEDDGTAEVGYQAGYDQADGVGDGTGQSLGFNMGNGADEALSGTLTFYNPSSTTFVKHFLYRGTYYYYSNRTINVYAAGYINDTNDVNAFLFGMNFWNTGSSSIDDGNFDGQISLYGISW